MILVTGATGNIGRLVVDELLRGGATRVRALTNNPEKAKLPAEVEVVRGYVGRPETVAPALEGVTKMYLAPLERTVREVTAMAADAGVRHIVDVSGGKDTWWEPVATAVEESGVPWTHLGPGEFMDNMLIWAGQIRTTGEVRDAYPDAANPLIDLRDIADVAATALLSDEHVGKEYTLTGPESLSRAELVRRIGAALGREVPYVEVAHDEAVEVLTPEMGDFARTYVGFQQEMAEHPLPVGMTSADITGRESVTFTQWAERNVDRFR